MKNKNLILQIIIMFFVLIIQAYSPVIYIANQTISPDIILVYITIMVLLFNRAQIIYFGFVLGLVQDLVSQVTLIGLFSFIKSLSAYCIGSISLYKSIWNVKIKYLVIASTYFLHFFIYFFIVINDSGSWLFILQNSVLQTIFSFGIFYLINNFIFPRKLF